MGKLNWGRVFLGGLLWWMMTNVLAGLGLFIVGEQWAAAMKTLGRPFLPPGFRAIWIAGTFVLGIVTIWLYHAVRPRYGPGPKTAALVGFAVWLILSLADAIWASMVGVPTALVAKGVGVYLVIIPVATVVGAWPYKE